MFTDTNSCMVKEKNCFTGNAKINRMRGTSQLTDIFGNA